VAMAAGHPLAERPSVTFADIPGRGPSFRACPRSAGGMRDFWLATGPPDVLLAQGRGRGDHGPTKAFENRRGRTCGGAAVGGEPPSSTARD